MQTTNAAPCAPGRTIIWSARSIAQRSWTGSWRCRAASGSHASTNGWNWARQPLNLRPNEFRLLHFFAQHPDRVLTRTDLIEALGKQEPPIDERTVDVWIGRLRRALRIVGAGERVRTVRSLGYVYDSYE